MSERDPNQISDWVDDSLHGTGPTEDLPTPQSVPGGGTDNPRTDRETGHSNLSTKRMSKGQQETKLRQSGILTRRPISRFRIPLGLRPRPSRDIVREERSRDGLRRSTESETLEGGTGVTTSTRSVLGRRAGRRLLSAKEKK